LGALGAILGTVAAVGIPLATALFNVGDKGEEAKTRLEGLTKILQEFNQNADLGSTKVDDLRKKYGEWAEGIKQTALGMTRINLDQAKNGLSDPSLTFSAGLNAVTAAKENATRAETAYLKAQDDLQKGMGDPSTVQTFKEAFEGAADALDQAAQKMGMSAAQALDLDAALKRLKDAKSIDDIANSAGDAAKKIIEMRDSGLTLPPPLLDAAGQLQNIVELAAQGATNIGDGADQAKRLADNLGIAASAKPVASIAMPGVGITQPKGASVKIMQVKIGASVGDHATIPGPSVGIDQPESASISVGTTKHGGSGGAGRSPAEQAKQDYDNLMASLDPLIRATDDYKKSLDTVNKQYATGAISEAEKAHALELIKQRFDDATASLHSGIASWAEFEKIGANALDSAVEHAGSLKEVLKDLLKELEMVLLKQALLGVVKGADGSMSLGTIVMKGLGGLLGFRAGGGPVQAGQPYVVGERQAELFVPDVSGTILPSTAALMTPRNIQPAAATGGMQRIQVQVSVDDDGKLVAVARKAGADAAYPVSVEVTKQAFKIRDRIQRTS
jgi:hypothetical protein